MNYDTMSERDRLIEIMAEARFNEKASDLDAVNRWDDLSDRERNHQCGYMRASLDAAEAAGFEIKKVIVRHLIGG